MTPWVNVTLTRSHTHSSSTTVHSKCSSSTSSSATSSKTTHSDTLVNLTMNKDVAGILSELESMYSLSSGTGSSSSSGSVSECGSESDSISEGVSDTATTTLSKPEPEPEPELGTMAAKLFFNEKVSEADVLSIEQCCDIFDLLDDQHPVLAQQGYSKLLELSLTKDRLQLVTCLCKRLLAQDVRLEKPFYDTLVTYLTSNGMVDDALAIAQTIPMTKQVLFALVEPLFLSGRHMQYAELFKTYCSPFNNDTTVTDVNLVIVSMIWAKGLCQTLEEAEREIFVASIVRSLESYKAIFHDIASRDPQYSSTIINKLFYVMQDSLEHVFLNCEDENKEDTAGIISNLRRKFVSSRYFSPFPFMPQDCTSSTNFPHTIHDITAQLAAGAVNNPDEGSAFFLSNYLWSQDYADVINSLVEERDDDSPYYDSDGDSDSDSDSDIDADYDSGIEEGASSSDDDDDTSDEDGVEYSINLKVDEISNPSLKEHHSLNGKSRRRVDMEAHIARNIEDLAYYHQRSEQAARNNAMKSFISGFQIEQKINLLLRESGMIAPEHNNYHDTRCPYKIAICEIMEKMAYVDEGVLDLSNLGDLSGQLRRDNNIRLSHDIFGFEPPHQFSESSYDSLKFMKDDVNWGHWKR